MKSKLFHAARESEEANQPEELEQPKDLEANLEPVQPKGQDIPIPEEGKVEPDSADAGPPDAAALPQVDDTPVDSQVTEAATGEVPPKEGTVPAPDADTPPVQEPTVLDVQEPVPEQTPPATEEAPSGEPAAEPTADTPPAEGDAAPAETPPAEPETTEPPAAQEPATPEVPSDPGEATEFDEQLQAGDEQALAQTEDDQVAETDNLNAAAGEIERVVITLETFAEMISEGDIDPTSQEIIEQTIAAVQQDFHFPEEPTPAIESIDEWKPATLQKIQGMKAGLIRGLAKAREAIETDVLENFELLDRKLAEVIDELNSQAQEDLDGDKEVDLTQFPYLVSAWEDKNPAYGAQISFNVVKTALEAAKEVGHARFDTAALREVLSKYYKVEAARDGFFVSLTGNMGPRRLHLVVTIGSYELKTEHLQYSNDAKIMIERASLKPLLAKAAVSATELRATLQGIKDAVQAGPAEGQDLNAAGLSQVLYAAASGPLARHQLSAYKELVAMTK